MRNFKPESDTLAEWPTTKILVPVKSEFKVQQWALKGLSGPLQASVSTSVQWEQPPPRSCKVSDGVLQDRSTWSIPEGRQVGFLRARGFLLQDPG